MSANSLNLGTSVLPLVGFGTYYISNDDAKSVVFNALKAGYRHIDTAQAYDNEQGVGEAITQAIAEGIVTRDELFVTTKLWPGNANWGMDEKNYDETIAAFNSSLQKLNLEYVDLYLIHSPFSQKLRIEQWKALIALQEEGKVKHIGVSNYNIHHLEEIKNLGLALPQVNQIEIHPWSQKVELRAYLQEHNILSIAYSSLVPLSSWRATDGQISAKSAELTEADTQDQALFKQIASAHNVSEAQVLLRWAVQQNIPVIPKSVHFERMAQNFDLFSFVLSADEMEQLNNLNRGSGVAWQTGDPSDYEL